MINTKAAAKRLHALERRFIEELPLRVSTSRWAGGANYKVKLAHRLPDGSVGFYPGQATSNLQIESGREWSSNGKWSGMASYHTLYLMPADDFRVVGGLFTIAKKREWGKSAHSCVWYEQGRGFTAREKRGWLIQGYHIEAPSLNVALAAVQKRLERAAKACAAKEAQILTAKYVNMNYGFCLPGIRNFCELAGLDMGGKYTLADLRALPESLKSRFSLYLKKMGA